MTVSMQQNLNSLDFLLIKEPLKFKTYEIAISYLLTGQA